MSQIENIKYDKAPEYTSDTNEDRYKDIIMKSIYAKQEGFNVDDYEVFEEEYVEQKARESIENFAEEWWENLRHNWKDNYIMNFVEFDINEYIEGCINIDGIETHASLEEYDEVEYEAETYYVINRGDIPW
jgi:hypothetical protein